MGDITGIIKQYVDEEALPDFMEQLSNDLRQNIQDVIAPGNPGYKSGHLHDTMKNNSSVNHGVGIATVWYIPYYGKYVDQGHHSWKGVQFMQRGLAKTVALYGGASWI